MPDWEAYLGENRSRYRAELDDLLRIPSISALPENAGDVRRAAEWVADRMHEAGIEGVEIMETGGHPVVYGEWLHAPGKPTILLYGHFDVQPVDPLNLWESPPFEPTERNGRIYARGVSDMKANLYLQIIALEALLKTTGELPVNVKFFYEGQEEIGSPQVPGFLVANKDRFAGDLVVSGDSGQWSENQPEIPIGNRGLAGLELHARGANSDLHSGLYGGAVQNPLHALVQLLDSMRGEDGRILVEGFYDDVVPLTPEDRASLAAIPFDEAEFKRDLGVTELFGEQGYTPRERIAARPTLELNGLWGGFQGVGSKTVLPNEAHAKITCRLVPDQNPDRILDRIEEHVTRHTPPGVEITVRRSKGTAKPYGMPIDQWGNQAARDVLVELYDKEPYYTRNGGTIPVTELFQRTLGVYTVGFGFGMDDERYHAPNEFLRLNNFERGKAAYCRLFERLGRGEG